MRLRVAVPEDAARIAEIHMAEFGSNALLRAQFPTEEVRRALRDTIEMKARADIEDTYTTVLVVSGFDKATARPAAGSEDLVLSKNHDDYANLPGARSRSDTVVGFAKWIHPTQAEQDYQEPPWVWPLGTAYDVLNKWTHVAEEAQEVAVGAEPCYRLTFIATDSRYAKQGAGSLMVAWGMNLCEEDGVPAYLESTLEAVPFYEKFGFARVAKLSMEIFERVGGEQTAGKDYHEIGMVFRPRKKFAV